MEFTPRKITPAGTLVTLASHYLDSLRTQNYAANTITSYRVALEQFAGFALSKDISIVAHVSETLVEDFIEAMLTGEGWSHRTAAHKLEVIKGFMRYCVARSTINRSPIENLKIKFQARRVIAPPESELMMVIESIPVDGVQNLRDRALLRLMFDSALRVSGLLTLDLYNAKQPTAHCVHPSGVVSYCAKGGKTKTTVIGEQTLADLDAWLYVRDQFTNGHMKAADKNALCLTRLGTRMCRANLHSIIKKHGARVGMPQLHAHLFRHRRLGDVYQQTGDIRIAADMGGHESTKTCSDFYGHVSAEIQRKRILTEAPLGAASVR